MAEGHNNGVESNIANRMWRAERRLEELERHIMKLEVRAERLEQRYLPDATMKTIIYIVVAAIVALVTGTSVNLSGLLK